MVEKKIFNSILNDDRVAALKLFNTKYNEINRVLKNSRLKNLFFELLNFNDVDAEKFLNLKKTNLIRNQLIISEIIKISQMLDESNIRYVFIKGAASLIHFKNIRPLRETSDIDVLINLDDLKKLHKLFNKNKIQHKFNYRHNYLNSKLNHSLESVKLDSGIYLDIHFRASSPLDFKICPFTDKFLESYDIKNYSGVFIKIITKESIFYHSIYQLFIRNEINQNSSSVIDLITCCKECKNFLPNKDNFFLEKYKIFQANKKWESIKKSLNSGKHNNNFFKQVYKKPKIEVLKKIKILYLNLRYINTCTIEKYGYEASKKNLYMRFLKDKLLKLSDI